MVDAKQLGEKGEKLAAEALKAKGYEILRRNYVYQKAEVDIIVATGNTIVFVEVKTRVSAYLTDPSLLVPVSKQRQIIKAADQFIKDFYPEREWRFDIMIVVTNKEYTSIEHIEDAFYPMV